ncbi:hypothetical protein NQZ68_026374 [Dissostichus eleginoides]|nr:hypothetical protein NQZ68_026374 [Dissostichus eleginoides]
MDSQQGRQTLFGHEVRAYSLSPTPVGPPLYRKDCLLEDDEEEVDWDWVDDDDDDEEEEEVEEQAHGHTLKVAINVPDERRSLVNACELNSARLKHSRMSFFLSGLLVMALTMLWLAFI